MRPRFTWLGHSTVRCDLPTGEVVLIDPWVTNPWCPKGSAEFERIDAILITHGHPDHLGDTVALARSHTPRLIVANFEICVWLEAQGLTNTRVMNLGGSCDVLGMQVTMVRADHSSGIQTPDGQVVYGGLASGYVVRMESGFTFYHAGDTALFSDMLLLAELYRPELAFLPIGDLFTMDTEQAARACRLLGVRHVVPIHWGSFPELTGTPDDLARRLTELGVGAEVVRLQPGQSW